MQTEENSKPREGTSGVAKIFLGSDGFINCLACVREDEAQLFGYFLSAEMPF